MRDRHSQRIPMRSIASRACRLELLDDRRLLNGDNGGSGGAAPLLPDLIAWESEERGYVHGWTVQQEGERVLLRMTTAMANIGAGPLELRGSTSHPDGTQDVLQRIYNDDGSSSDRLAGQFIYHAEHGHVHFAGFAEYALREVLPDNGVGDVVATGGKTSFCLVDLDDFDSPLVGAPDKPRYQTCSNTVVGISVGWADVYEEGLPDQWIDVTDVPEGPYWLEVAADPDDHISELDETNNVARILINYVSPEPLAQDAYEPNDGWDNYRDLGRITSTQLFENLTVHAPGNDDYFTFTAVNGGLMNVELRFDHAAGDLNLFVYAGPLHEIGYSVGTTNVEKVVVPVTENGFYGIRVIGAAGNTSPAYALSLVPGHDGGRGTIFDDYEPNNDRAHATMLPSVDQSIEDLNIHSAVDEDHFRWNAPATGPLTISADFAQADGDIDLYVYNIAGNLVAASAGDADGESVTLDAYAGQIYFIKLDGRGLAVNPHYSLRIDGPEPMLGDTDLDGVVDVEDLNNVRYYFGLSGPTAPGDADHDGDVDIEDLNAVRNHFGAGQNVVPALQSRVAPLRRTDVAAHRPPAATYAVASDLLFARVEQPFEFPLIKTRQSARPQRSHTR